MTTKETASVPMLSLSRRHGMEAYCVGSQSRACPRCVYVSSISSLGHESLPHGPLFSTAGGCAGPRRRPGAMRWSAEYLVFTGLLMVYSPGATLADRFRSARECLVEIFVQRRRPGRGVAYHPRRDAHVAAMASSWGLAAVAVRRGVGPIRAEILQASPRLAPQKTRDAAGDSQNPPGHDV